MKIDLHIERLILDGVDTAPGQRHLLRAAVETELASLLSARGLSFDLSVGGARHQVSGNAIQLSRGFGAIDLGRQIAASVYAGIRK